MFQTCGSEPAKPRVIGEGRGGGLAQGQAKRAEHSRKWGEFWGEKEVPVDPDPAPTLALVDKS